MIWIESAAGGDDVRAAYVLQFKIVMVVLVKRQQFMIEGNASTVLIKKCTCTQRLSQLVISNGWIDGRLGRALTKGMGTGRGKRQTCPIPIIGTTAAGNEDLRCTYVRHACMHAIKFSSHRRRVINSCTAACVDDPWPLKTCQHALEPGLAIERINDREASIILLDLNS